jgi:hypothetical protein
LSGLKRGCDASTPSPNVGLPFPVTISPSRSISFAVFAFELRSRICPLAASTSGSARTRRSTLSVTSALPWSDQSTSERPLTTASVCAYELVKIESNALDIVSVRTKLPVTIETPRTIENAVRTVRSLRPRIPLSATRVTGR